MRSLIKRAIEISKDDFHGVYSTAVEFERKFGTLDELESIERRYKEKVDKINQASVVVAEDLTIHEEPKKEFFEKPGKRNYDKHLGEDSQRTDDALELRQDKKAFGERRPIFGDAKNTIFIKNLPYSFTEPDIRALFAHAGKITSVRIVMDKVKNLPKGLAYVDFEDSEQALKACESNGLDIDGRRLSVAISDPPKKGKQDDKTVFVNNLPYNVTEQALRSQFKDMVIV